MGFENVESIFIDNKEVQSIVVKDSGGILFQKSIDITNLPIMELEITGNSFSTYSSTPFTYTGRVFVDWGDDTGLIEYTGDQLTHTYSNSDDYTVKIYGDITSLENNCFRSCTGLTSINIPSSVTNLGLNCFYDCTGLTSIVIPSSVTSIKNYCFYRCTGLTSIEIPNSVTSLAYACFYGCTGLTSIVIPSNVTSLGTSCFNSCTGLTSIVIPSSVTSLGNYCFEDCTGLTSVTIPNNVTSLGSNCFNGCTGLTSIEIPSGVISLGSNCFNGCISLTSIILNWDTNDEIITYNQNWITNTSSNLLFHTPDSTESLYIAKGYPLDKIYEDYLELEFTGQTLSQQTSNTLIGSDIFIDYGDGNVVAYEGDYSHTYTTSGNYTIKICGVTGLGNDCFRNCDGLTSIVIPSSVTNLQDNCFRYCDGLTSIEISNGITSLGDSCFGGCVGLTSVTIPNSVTSLGSDCFNGCINLTSIIIPNSVTSLGPACFTGCSSLTSIEIPNSVTSLGEYCFYRCTGLTSIILNWDTNNEILTYNQNWITNASSNLLFHIPSSKTSLYTAKGYPLEKLEEKLSNNIMELEITGNNFSTYKEQSTPFTYTGRVFIDWGDNTGLIEYTGGRLIYTYGSSDNYTIKIYGDITSIEDDCFYGRTSLTSIVIPNSVTSIGNFCFDDCTNLTSVVIPNSVTSIGNSCFYGCTDLTSIEIPSSVTSLGKSCFMTCISLTSITISNGVTSLGEYCFSGCRSLTSIVIPDSVTSLGKYCFTYCTGLTNINLKWDTSNKILTYNSSWISNANNDLKFSIPSGTTGLYINQEYPLEKLEEIDVIFVGDGKTTGWYDGQSFTIQNVSLEDERVKWTVPSSDKYLGYYTNNTQSIAGKTLCTTVKISSVKNVKLIGYVYTDEWINVHNFLIPSGEDGEVTIYTQIPFNASRVWIRLQQNSSTDPLNQGDIVYVEKWRTYLVDYLFKDTGTLMNHTNSIWYVSNLQMNRLEEYTELVESTIGTTGHLVSYTFNRIPQNSVIEFDFMQVDGAKTQTPIYIRNNAGGVSLGYFNLNQINCEVGEWIHIKIVIEDTVSYKIYVNDNPTPIIRTFSQTDTLYRLYFSTDTQITQLRYKNLICYPLESKEENYLFKYEGLGGTESANFVGADNRVTVETSSSGTSLTGVSGFYVYWANVPQTSDDAFDFMGDTVIEFDVVEIANNGGAVLQIYDNDDTHTYFNKKLRDNMGVTGACHIKITVIDNLVTVYRDGNIVDSCTTQMTLTNPYRIGFRGYEGWNFKFKNFNIIKPLFFTYDGISLTSNKSILSYADNETYILTAQLTHNNDPVNISGQTIEFFNGLTSMGTAQTNSSGMAIKSYTSAGAGDITLTAKVDTYTSEPVSIEDCFRYDDASADKTSNYSTINLNSLTFVTDHYEAYRSLGSSPTSTYYSPIYIDETLPSDYEISVDMSSSTANAIQNMISIASSHLQTYSGSTEFGVLTTASRNTVFSRLNGTGSFKNNNNQNLSANTYYKYILQVEGTTVTATIKDMQDNIKYSNSMTVSFAQDHKKWSIIVGEGSHTVKWKNLKIKPL